ncbi:hypothetical protein [Aliivibrio salmonicida]|uniref:Uncharacterized protein n=1 Tax=Aliivibrio salmonicida (strain LFI1238) TaxID=316275 RepID=B6ERH3_ALISL|nr:hypothetical protein [Aliivibrio salmonicida]CAQ81306.1 hypothetical protein, putative phage gene [Aliivibrio salmonicida LFI1238]
MIGWKILCALDDKEVVCEVVGQVTGDGVTYGIPVYHNGYIRMVNFRFDAEIKVIERK